MLIDVVTIFPDYLAPLDLSLIGTARRKGLIDLRVHDLRDFTHDRHRTVDDTPYGGGAGMVMRPEPWARHSTTSSRRGRAAPGRVSSSPARAASGSPRRWPASWRRSRGSRSPVAAKGIDERVYEHADQDLGLDVHVVSLGDYVLNGGEVAVLAMVEAVARLLPGVIGNAESLVEESHEDGLLEYPVYTKPARWRDRAVPEVLLSGNHAAIARWRRDERLRRTALRRPDMIAALDDEPSTHTTERCSSRAHGRTARHRPSRRGRGRGLRAGAAGRR